MPDSDGDASLEAKDDIAPQLSDNTIRIAGPLVHRFNRGEKLSDKEFMQIISCIMKDGSGKEEAVRFAQAS